MKIVGLAGFAGSGKDTAAAYLRDHCGFRVMAYADALKDTLAAIFRWDRKMLDGRDPISRDWREQEDIWWASKLGIAGFSPRWAMRNIATEVMRRRFHPDIWTLGMEQELNQLAQSSPDSSVVLTDLRFPNEFKLVRDRAGLILRIRRGPDPNWYAKAERTNLLAPETAEAARIEVGVHESEWNWIGQKVDADIDNDTTPDALGEAVCKAIF
jgi:hypothetical protein